MNNATVGYVLVSRTVRVRDRSCGKAGCVQWKPGMGYQEASLCPMPERPGCRAVCLHGRAADQHPECQEYERELAEWQAAHQYEEPTGGTRLGPLHYFGDCRTLLHRGPRRADARIVELDANVAEQLGLPVCKECAAKMAPFEAEIVEFDLEKQVTFSKLNRCR